MNPIGAAELRFGHSGIEMTGKSSPSNNEELLAWLIESCNEQGIKLSICDPLVLQVLNTLLDIGFEETVPQNGSERFKKERRVTTAK